MSWMTPPSTFDPEEVENPNDQLAAADTGYVPPDLETEQAAVLEHMFDRLAALVPGWEAHDGNQETILLEPISALHSELLALARDVPGSVMVSYAVEVLGQQIRADTPATATARWTARNQEGYEVLAGWQITVARTGDDLIGFETLEPAVILPGDTSVDVPVVAIEAGAAGNGVTGVAEEADPVDWVQSVELVTVSQGGHDGQQVQEFLDGLRGLMQVVGLTPVRAEHFAILARWFWGGRCLALDLFDPADRSWGNWLTITLVVSDDQGEPWPPAVKAEMLTWFTAHTLVGSRINVIDFQYQAVDVIAEVTMFAGQDRQLVKDICEDAIRQTLSPASFRLGMTSPSILGGEVILPPEAGADPPTATTIRVNDLIGLLDRCRGVDFVGSVLINGQPQDVEIGGLYTLPRPGVVEVTVNAR